MGLKRQNLVGWAVLLAAVAIAPSSSLNFDLAVDLGMFDPVVYGDDFLAFSGSDASHAWMRVGSGGDWV